MNAVYLQEKHYPGNIVTDTQVLRFQEGADISEIVCKDVPCLVKLEFDVSFERPISRSKPLKQGELKGGEVYEVYRPLESKKSKNLYDICKEIEQRIRVEGKA